MDLLEPLSQTFDHTTKVLAGVGPDQFGQPTPCTEWDLQALMAHALGVVVNMGRGARGEELLAEVNAFPVESDPSTQFRTEADRTLAAWTARGLDGDVNVGAGPMPVIAALTVNLLDTTTHCWDIARATGQDPSLPDELAGTVLAVSRSFVSDEIRAGVGIDPPVAVPDDANPTDQLVAFMGRRP